MPKSISWKVVAGAVMIVLAAAFYILHYMIFRDLHHIFLYLITDIGFVFIEVLLITLVIHQLFSEWEKTSQLKKLNMVIEVFFSEFGKHLLVYLSNHDKNLKNVQDLMIDKNNTCSMDFKCAFDAVKSYKSDIDMNKIDLQKLAKFLTEKRPFLIGMLQNPNLLEHETFTETIMAIFHITEELAARNLSKMSSEDLDHTKVDIERAYNKLTHQWLLYMQHTEKHFPYFFLFAMKTNPFDEKDSWLEKWYEQSK
ncbi:MAG: hypothetical protein LHV68_06165 [Elusimicrobia bacterium]|nr:hypothetical protein [Candidatus Liberimonas magnetica]